jgi:alanine racemase
MNQMALDTHPAWMELDFEALRANFQEVRRRVAPDVKIMASIKANAYGHGAVEMAHALAALGVDLFATASFEDAVRVREAGIATPIVMFGGNLPSGIAAHLRHDLTPSVYNMQTAELISRSATSPTKVFLKVDIGLGRLGVPIDEAEAFVARVKDLPNIIIEGLYTHISFRDDETRAYAGKRLPTLYRLVDRLSASGIDIPVTQALDSCFILHDWTDDLSAICPGHVLYGISPCAPGYVDLDPFRPVLKGIRAQLIHVVRHPAEGPAPGESWYHKHRRGDTTGVIPLGLYDGYRKPVAGKGSEMVFRGQRIPVLGVSLEYTVVDLVDFPDAQVGEEITVVGESAGATITLEEVAARLDISPLEFLMSVSGRLPRSNSIGVAEEAAE